MVTPILPDDTMDERTAPAPGCLLVIVGPSGVGKDSLIDACRRRLEAHPRVEFARRVITRSVHVNSEDHHAVDEARFAQWLSEGRFAVHWHAHGLRYGLPVETLHAVLDGHVVIANGSRGALNAIKMAFPRVWIVHVTACRAVIEQRLRQRGRESAGQIRDRLDRHALLSVPDADVREIDNSGELENSVRQLTDLIREALAEQ